MKIVHLSTFENYGGAAIAANKLYTNLNNIGVTSYMLVAKKTSREERIIPAYNTIFEKVLWKFRKGLEIQICKKRSRKKEVTFSTCMIPFSLLNRKISEINPDIIHIHWVQYGFVNLNDILKFNKPIVWTLHDIWPISDGVHYYYDTSLLNLPERKIQFNLKKKVFSKKDITLICNSLWVEELVKKSVLGALNKFSLIPNGIDCNEFFPIDKNIAKTALGIEKSKKVIVVGAVSVLSNKIKGFRFVNELFNKFKFEGIQVLVFGDDSGIIQIGQIKALSLGRIENSALLRTIYSAADLFLVPSLMETFGLTVGEAMACGTPVVAFNYSGIVDLINHKENGYLANPYDVTDLKKGVDWILSNDTILLGKNAREKIINSFEMDKIAKQHYKLYKTLLEVKDT